MTRRKRDEGAPSRAGRPDIELDASVSADELRFTEAPETEVRFFGEPGHESDSRSVRVNLPERVEAGVTYRDVRVDYRLATRIVEPDEDDPPAA